MAELKDGLWKELKITSLGFEAQLDNSFVILWRDSAIKLHNFSPVDTFEFITETLKIKFVDLRVWEIKLYSRNINTDVSYNLNNNTKWTRDLILNYITPLINTTIQLYANYSLEVLEGKPF